LAVDVSCSQSGVGSFIAGLSGANIRAGLAGKWDQLFNLKIPKLRDGNKYRKLTELLTAMHLAETELVGTLAFSPAEKFEGLRKFESVIDKNNGKMVGVFVGGRKLRGKRWPLENFIDLINGFERSDVHVIVFLGPEENDLADPIRRSLASITPIVCEPSVRKFAATISNLDLFVCCDSGPMHLACAVGVPVVAIFQERDVARWAPPPGAARVVYGAGIVDPGEVLRVVLEELSIGSTDAYPITPRPVTSLGRN
jgi:ADP-heptose:LPS heptosyltransferase